MKRYLHRLAVPLSFPAGLAPGEGKSGGNRAMLARDGLDRPVLRGSALAGALRHAWGRSSPAQVARWFGMASDEDPNQSVQSALRVHDVVLHTGRAKAVLRAHNAVDRHTGSVRDGGLFEFESLPPGTDGLAILLLEDDSDPLRGKDFLAELVAILDDGLVLGGRGARGIGRVEVGVDSRYFVHDRSTVAGMAAWLDESWLLRGERLDHGRLQGKPLAPKARERGQTLKVSFTLAVAPGQDVCIGDAGGLDYAATPQRVRHQDGHESWRLPGSTLRGILRSWVTRLAARAGHPVADSVQRYREKGAALGDDAGWGFRSESEREAIVEKLDGGGSLVEAVPCPVMRLFGSLYSAGRIHLSDAYTGSGAWSDTEPPIEEGEQGPDWQVRKHVAVDGFTGGANDGFLYSHAAVTSARWTVSMTVRDPSEEEARWLAQSLRAIDMGLLRVGTSKSSGRLSLATAPRASGPHMAIFHAIKPMEMGR